MRFVHWCPRLSVNIKSPVFRGNTAITLSTQKTLRDPILPIFSLCLECCWGVGFFDLVNLSVFWGIGRTVISTTNSLSFSESGWWGIIISVMKVLVLGIGNAQDLRTFPVRKARSNPSKKNENENNLMHIGVNRLIHSGS